MSLFTNAKHIETKKATEAEIDFDATIDNFGEWYAKYSYYERAGMMFEKVSKSGFVGMSSRQKSDIATIVYLVSEASCLPRLIQNLTTGHADMYLNFPEARAAYLAACERLVAASDEPPF